MRWSTLTCFLLFLAGMSFGLLQMWFHPWDHELFGKILLTDIALFIVCFVWGFLVKENKETKKVSGESNSLE